MLRRPHLALLLLAAIPTPAGAQTLKAVLVTDGIQRPTHLTSPPGDDRLFVTASQEGIYVIENGQVLPDLFLDLSATLGGQGLMSLAFLPDYASNGRFFVTYLDAQLATHVVEYLVSSDPNLADPSSAVEVFGPYPQPSPIHNWNHLQFGPDGMLYLSTGNGAWNGDPTAFHAQDLASPLGKVLRFDVDLPFPHVPADNPYVGVPGAEERVWAYGLRQPWRMDFDPDSGDVYVTDVGSNMFEEINVLPIADLRGANFGWRCLEGLACTNFMMCNPICGDPSWIEPTLTYDHSGFECAVIGGVVYRGDDVPWFQGSYIYGDHCSARIWTFRWDGTAITEHVDRTFEIQPDDGTRIDFINSFAVDDRGEMYVLDNSGHVYRIVDGCGTERTCDSLPNSAGAGAQIAWTGTLAMTANDFTLRAAGCPPSQFGMFFYGFAETSQVFGDGLLCVEPPHYRFLPAVGIDTTGRAALAVDLTAPPVGQGTGSIEPGTSFFSQFWYRDPAAGGAGFNTTDGLRVRFCP